MQSILINNITLQQLRSEMATTFRQELAVMQTIATAPISDPPMDTRQACAYLGIAQPTLYRRVANNSIPHHRKGKKLIFFQSELREWIKEKK